MHNVAKARMQTFQHEASQDEIKKAHLCSLPRLSLPASAQPCLPVSHCLPACPVCTPLLPPLPHPPHAPLFLSVSLGPQTQTAQNVVDRIQKFKRFEAAAAPPGQLKLKSGSPVGKV